MPDKATFSFPLAFAPICPLQAQSVRGTILGTVTDAPALRSEGHTSPPVNSYRLTRTETTNHAGEYSILQLPLNERNVVIGPPTRDFDFAVLKNFTLFKESRYLQFRSRSLTSSTIRTSIIRIQCRPARPSERLHPRACRMHAPVHGRSSLRCALYSDRYSLSRNILHETTHLLVCHGRYRVDQPFQWKLAGTVQASPRQDNEAKIVYRRNHHSHLLQSSKLASPICELLWRVAE